MLLGTDTICNRDERRRSELDREVQVVLTYQGR